MPAKEDTAEGVMYIEAARREVGRIRFGEIPRTKILSLTTEFIMRLLGLHKDRNDAVTEDDITGMLREGADAFDGHREL